MCANLVRAGHDVVAHDLRPELESEVLAIGAGWARTASEAAAAAEVLVTMLPGPHEVVEAMTGAGGALGALPAGATWIDMTSNTSAAAEPIRVLAVARGVELVAGGPR